MDSQLFDDCPPNPTIEGYHPLYEQCHRCDKWFDVGTWFWRMYFNCIDPIHGTYNDPSQHYENINGSTIGFTCPECVKTPCTIVDCACYGPVYFCKLCLTHRRGFKRMETDDMCVECYEAFKVGKRISHILKNHRPKSFEEFYALLDE